MDVHLGCQTVGRTKPVYIIAEAGVNHTGDEQLALELIDVAASAGVDAVKFQTFIPELLATSKADCADYQKTTGSRSQQKMLTDLSLPAESFARLCSHAHSKGVAFLSTPFDYDSAEMLADLDVSAFKVSSGDLTNIPLLSQIAQINKPIILSTGMATIGEIERAVDSITVKGNAQIVLLHCTSEYPTPVSSANLKCIETIARAFPYPIGYSDHTPGTEIPVAAVALGACVIEKHFTLDRRLPGPDQGFSLEPDELTDLVGMIRCTEQALGTGIKRPTAGEEKMKQIARRSIVALCDIEVGMEISKDMLIVKRPGTGIKPEFLPVVCGRKAQIEILADTPITWDMV